jgi:hypothetical protein
MLGVCCPHPVRSLASLGVGCTMRYPRPMVSLSPLGHGGVLSSRVRETEAPCRPTWTSAEIAPFCRLASPPVPLSLPDDDRTVDTKNSSHARVSEMSGDVVRFLLNQSMQILFHRCSVHLPPSETAAAGRIPYRLQEVDALQCGLPTCATKPVGDRVGYAGVPASCRLPFGMI